MRAVLSNFSFSEPFSFIGLSVTVKIITAVVAVIVAAGGVVYTLSQKSYAAKTINFDGRELFLVAERNGYTGKVISAHDADTVIYAAVYFDFGDYTDGVYNNPAENYRKWNTTAENRKEWNNFFYYQVLYAAHPKQEFVQDGVYSANAFMNAEWQSEWQSSSQENTFGYQIRETTNGDVIRLFIDDPHQVSKDLRVRVHGKRCGVSTKNAFACISYKFKIDDNQYATAKEWAEKEGAAHLERMYELLTAYPLAHNEELLADMKLAVEGQL